MKLSSFVKLKNSLKKGTFFLKITKNKSLPSVLSANTIFLGKKDSSLDNNKFLFTSILESEYKLCKNDYDIIIPDKMSYLDEGDVIKLDTEKGFLKTMYRRNSSHNSFLITERCNSFCLMCSQPPKDIDDSYLAEDIIKTIPLIDKETSFLGITGGEPTLLKEKFIEIISMVSSYLPNTSLQVLSNGRNFKNINLCNDLALVSNSNFQICIPLYSDVSHIHNFVVQSEDAWNETIQGILNLKRFNQKVEIRVVIHKQTFNRLPELATFISKNLGFVDHVALMGLEMMGFTKANIDDLWIDPLDYSKYLIDACKILETFKIPTSIYNHQLCLLDKSLWKLARKSISDWKNIYMKECDKCLIKNDCGGFFASAIFKHSENIKAFYE